MNKEEVTLYKDLLNDTKEQLANEIIQKNRELDKLEDVIYKAIEYIEHYLEEDKINCGNIYHSVYDELLDILKGSNTK